MTIIISAPSFKGGVGKSTTIINLGGACARAGLRTVVIDADMQGNASMMMGVQKTDGFYALIAEGARWSDVLQPVPRTFTNDGGESLFVLPGALQTTHLKKNDITIPAMVDLLGMLRGWADVVLIDTAPGFDDIHAGMYAASDYIVLPTQCELDSIESIADTFALMNATAAALPRAAKVLGILPTMFNPKLSAHLLGHDTLKVLYRRQYALFDPILDLTAFKDARTRCMSIYAHAETIRGARGMGRRMDSKSAQRAVNSFDEAIANRVIALARQNATVAA